MSKLKQYNIVDLVSNHITTPVMAANGKSALKKFMACLMSRGIYEIIKKGDRWHLVSSFGSDFEAVPAEEV